jgi:glutamyl-tRNA reductase
MGLILVGLNHRTAPLPVRERVVYTPSEALDTLRELKQRDNVPQALLLSTCNRTELYAIVADAVRAVPEVKEKLFYGRIADDNGREDLLYVHANDEAVRHLFRVACGLDSMVLGENEILGQVKAAYEISRSADTVGTVFHRLANRAFRVGKRARTETRIGRGAVSVAYAAVELAEKVFEDLGGRGALLLGAGQNGALCAEHLLAHKVDPLLIANRTPAKAEALAQRLGGETIPFGALGQALAQVDVVVSTTGSQEPIVSREMVRDVMRVRGQRPLVLIDIAVPRDIAPGAGRLRHVFRFDMQALESIVEQNVALRRGEVSSVEQLVASEVKNFMRWWKTLGTGPVIRDIHQQFESIRDSEVSKHAKRFLSEDRERLQAFTRHLVRRLLMSLTKEIKQYQPDDPLQMERLAALREVFRLDEDGPGEDTSE